KGKTRKFWQIGFEILNYSELESSLEAIRTANELIRSSGLDTATIRIADKRLLKGLIGKFSPEEQKIIKKIIDKSDDSPEKFVKLYSDNGGTDPSVSSEVGDFLSLIHEDELTIGSLRKHASGSETYQQGVENLGRLYEQLQREMQIKILPFMSKSWDACDKMMFDVRDKSFDGALCGGGNLTYQNYRPDAFKSGAGIGVTRVNEILKRKG
ncbi:MAG: ATP phosphoribosyltransferase regulatory subunit, partial [Nanoarchaeota archaeon]|nr:ATP phosphoribosyltransferase regulatory subunit [Nanoarchaeota archaeon]